MSAHQAKNTTRAVKTYPRKAPVEPLVWIGPKASATGIEKFGVRLNGGGPHQSKTMMLAELKALLSTRDRTPVALKQAVIDDNILGKATANTRALTYRHIAALYGLNTQPILTRAFFSLWRACPENWPLLALLVALARDPLLRDTGRVVTEGAVGSRIQRPAFEDVLLAKHPGRFSSSMMRSLSQNCASTWTQSGHLVGPVRKVRQRVTPTPQVVALAALLATVCGFGGPAMLSSGWMKVLDLSADQALDLLRKAEGQGLARVRSAGDVTEISVRPQMASTLGVAELEYV